MSNKVQGTLGRCCACIGYLVLAVCNCDSAKYAIFSTIRRQITRPLAILYPVFTTRHAYCHGHRLKSFLLQETSQAKSKLDLLFLDLVSLALAYLHLPLLQLSTSSID
ncbi:uncharacterized protein N7479_006435 [Penicillium vulpinum]|uniref:uncharacterized protein n=1 Tax=Penicillium vulpinum TaxID=29845 RepID=UPI002546C3F3|nr:uncharacterized protein N7479_006435 [Penicillium vulpinum]KAJ5959285.1 hypothetical protein N7479_006435 [Penicillium vulpinum]